MAQARKVKAKGKASQKSAKAEKVSKMRSVNGKDTSKTASGVGKKQQPKETVVRLCPCGCKGELANGSQFRIGHDGRMHGMFKKVDKGKMQATELNEMQHSIYEMWKVGVSLREVAIAIKTEWAYFR